MIAGVAIALCDTCEEGGDVVVAIEPWEERRQSDPSAELKTRCRTGFLGLQL